MAKPASKPDWEDTGDTRFAYLFHLEKLAGGLADFLGLQPVPTFFPGYAATSQLDGDARAAFSILVEVLSSLSLEEINGIIAKVQQHEDGKGGEGIGEVLANFGFDTSLLAGIIRDVSDAISSPLLAANAKWPELLLPAKAENPIPPPMPFVASHHLDTCPVPEKGTPITAIIDDGIMPFHHRFRSGFESRKTRILGHWEQQGVWQNDPGLPFGRWLTPLEIEGGLLKIDRDVKDEIAMCRDIGLFTDGPPGAAPELFRAASHGMHVADLSGGMEPWSLGPVDRPLITVNIPARQVISFAGSYLIFYVLHAISRIAQFVDALWKHYYPNETDCPWPVVIALPYGQSAGRRDSLDQIAFLMSQLDQKTDLNVSLIMPSGNNNLDRTHAVLEAERGKKRELFWRTIPGDQSLNFSEIWTDPYKPQSDDSWLLKIGVEGPGGLSAAVSAPHTDPSNGMAFRVLTQSGKACGIITARRTGPNSNGEYRTQYLVSLAPTERTAGLPSASFPTSIPGLYKISLEPIAGKFSVVADVQVDLAFSPDTAVSKVSYFDDPNFDRYDPNGTYPRDVGNPSQDTVADNTHGFTKQFGAANALVADQKIISVAGYVGVDGTPWLQSALASGEPARPTGERAEPTLALPVHEGPGTFGNLGAGTRSGSTRIWLGTSSAVGLAARLAVDGLDPSKTADDVLKDRAREGEKFWRTSRPPTCSPNNPIPRAKIGEGRAFAPATDRLAKRLEF